jgi:hypothetical protein
MEYELYDLNVVREAEHEGDVHDSTTLLDPSGGKALTKNKDIASTASEAYNANMSSTQNLDHNSEDDLSVHLMSFQGYTFINVLSRSPAKYRTRSLLVFIRPIIACSWQFIVLVALIVFIIRTETTAYPIVPTRLATLFVQYPQGTTIATTLVGSLLSLISTKYFSVFQSQIVDF